MKEKILRKWKFIYKPTLKSLLRIPYSTYLCIRFPFLYPRNRYTGKHHVHSELLSSIQNKLYNKSYDVVKIKRVYIPPKLINNDIKYINSIQHGRYEFVLGDDSYMNVYIDNCLYVTQYFNENPKKFKILGFSESNTSITPLTIYVTLHDEYSEDTSNYGFCWKSVQLIKSNIYSKLYNLIGWVHDNIIDNIFILPTYTELDAMDPGWRKMFGIAICKEIKAELKKYNALYRYRITQIKEKFGGLRWYDSFVPKDSKIYDIINAYEDLSLTTCIHCGKPATKMTKGWILPVCEECANKPNALGEKIPYENNPYYNKELYDYFIATKEVKLKTSDDAK